MSNPRPNGKIVQVLNLSYSPGADGHVADVLIEDGTIWRVATRKVPQEVTYWYPLITAKELSQ